LKAEEPTREFSLRFHEAFTRAVMRSPSWLAVFQLTDVLGLTARFNTPGSVSSENWSYRMTQTVAELEDDPYLAMRSEMFARVVRETGRAT
jgi:4-alpha-glucanotransferase